MSRARDEFFRAPNSVRSTQCCSGIGIRGTSALFDTYEVLVPPIGLNALLAYSLIFAVKVGRFVCGFVDYPISPL